MHPIWHLVPALICGTVAVVMHKVLDEHWHVGGLQEAWMAASAATCAVGAVICLAPVVEWIARSAMG